MPETTSSGAWWPASGRVSSSSRSATSSCSPSRCSDDVAELRDGQVLWGWPHCVQDRALTQLAIDQQLTLIAFEAMNHWTTRRIVQPARVPQEQRAGRLLLRAPRDADLGVHRRLRSAAARGGDRLRRDGPRSGHGAHGLGRERCRRPHPPPGRGRGRAHPLCAHPPLRRRRHHRPGEPRGRRPTAAVPLAEFLGEHDIIVNCVLQDTDAPARRSSRTRTWRTSHPARVVVDVSCDEGMGFSWARPTTFDDPTFVVGRRRALLRRRPQPVLPVERRDVGDQRGTAALPPARHRRDRRPGTRTAPSAGPSRSATASSRTPPSCRSRAVARTLLTIRCPAEPMARAVTRRSVRGTSCAAPRARE